MRITGSDGRWIELMVRRYQFPDRTPDPGPTLDWDANWLVVEGRLSLPDGRYHRFFEPCLTTLEGLELADWLEHRGSVTSAGPGDLPDREPELVFTEPCVAFDLVDASDDVVVIHIYLSLEAEPPWPIDGGVGLFENFMSFSVTRSELVRAAGEWRDELHAFPVR